jgi:hypothetical protein
VKRLSILMAVGVMGLAAVPATSVAASSHSARAHYRTADAALTEVAQYVISDPSRARAALVRDRRATAALARDARALRRAARNARLRVRAAKAYRLLAAQQNANVETLSALIKWADDFRLQMARYLTGAIDGRQAALDALQALAPYLPDSVQEAIAETIAHYSTDSQHAVSSLSDALAGGDLPTAVQGIVTSALDMLTAAISDAVDQLKAIVPLLPAEAQPLVVEVFALVNQNITAVTDIIKQVLGSVFGASGDTIGGIDLPDVMQFPFAVPGWGSLSFPKLGA